MKALLKRVTLIVGSRILCANQSWDVFFMNYFIFQHECAISTNFLYLFKDYHVAIFWTKVYVVPPLPLALSISRI
jgi:hypothetical protein